MQVPITVTNPLSAPATQALSRGLPWRAGAVLQAVVLDVSAPGRVELQIGNQTLSARALFALSEGQVLSLRVAHNGELVVLRAEPPVAGARAAAAPDALLAQQALREALPRQAALAPLLANVGFVARQPQRFPPALVDAARALLHAIPDLDEIVDPEALARRIERSGLWLESALATQDEATTPAALASDWKAALLRLAATLRPMIPAAPAGGTPAADAETLPASSAPREAPPAPLPATTAPVRAEPGAGAPAGPALAPARVLALLDEMAPPAARLAAARPEERAHDPARAAADPRVAARQAPPAQSFEAAPLLRASLPQPQSRVAPTLEPLVLATGDAARPAQHLLRQVEGAIARIELGQIASLPGDDPGTALWLLELPVRAPDGELDVLSLRIEREAAGSGAEEAPLWAVSLAFDLGELGALRARITVRGETVSTLFHAERAVTAERVGGRLADLEAALSFRGLKVGAVGCRAGMPEERFGDAAGDAPLLEVQA